MVELGVHDKEIGFGFSERELGFLWCFSSYESPSPAFETLIKSTVLREREGGGGTCKL